MTVDHDSLAEVHDHWALRALGSERLAAARSMASHLYVQRNLGHFLHGPWPDANSDELVHRAATAFEIVAAEGLGDLFRAQRGAPSPRALLAQAAAYSAFELRRALPLNTESLSSLMYQVLQLGSFAYVSDRWAEFRAWLRDRDVTPENLPDGHEDWDGQLLKTLAEVWIRLLRKQGWSDLTQVGYAIIQLRAAQSENEEAYLAAADGNGTVKPKAWRLIALYHWARASELLAEYMMQGTPSGIHAELDFHFERAIDASQSALDAPTEVTLKWLHILALRMVSGSLWSLTSAGRETRNLVANKTRNSLFELLPPQRTALLEQGLLDQASTAVVVDLPTSAGKTVLAQFKIIQALNQFREERGWVAYVAPTRALVSQVTRRLRHDLSPLGIRVEQLTAAVELDDLEKRMVGQVDDQFDVLVATPEKLQLLIRNRTVPRPLALLTLDEAHNIADKQRGVRIELLLATVKQDCPDANFLLLMPFVPNADDLARWLSPQSGRSISLGTGAWQPNDRMVGLVRIAPPSQPKDRNSWSIEYETLMTSAHTLVIDSHLRIGERAPLPLTYSKVKSNLGLIAASAARAMSDRGTSIVLAQKIPSTWSIAKNIQQSIDGDTITPEIRLVQRFLATEISPQFELIELLNSRIGVHHAGLSDEARSLMEWLAELGQLRVLVATTTIAQGINFPVSSVFVASRHISLKTHSEEMDARDFWNLVGRAGRVDQDSIGVVGLACREGTNDAETLTRYVRDATGALASRLVSMLDELDSHGRLFELERKIFADQWADFRSFVAHLYNQSQSLSDVLSRTELMLRNTFGYSAMADGTEQDREKGRALLWATRKYAESLSRSPENAKLADSTGFAPESVRLATGELRRLDRSLTKEDWQPESLFAGANSALPDLMGVLMKMPQVKDSIEELSPGRGHGERVAEITADWVNGKSIQSIAERYFMQEPNTDTTKALTETCRAIYRNLTLSGTWGISALSKLPSSGLDYENMEEAEIRRINLLGAMIYHGVSTEGGVAMRMASVPRSVADAIGEQAVTEQGFVPSAGQAREFLEALSPESWERHRPLGAQMSGRDYRNVWRILSGGVVEL